MNGIPAQVPSARETAPRPDPGGGAIVWWAALGALIFAFIVYVWTRWIASGEFAPVDPGPTPHPTFFDITARGFEIFSVAVFVAVIYKVVYKPWRRDGRLSWDGIFVLACGTLWWQDLLQNYGQNHALFNSHLVNMGSWYQFIPGWIAPSAENVAEPILYAGTWYISFLFVLVWIMNKAMDWARTRWPEITTAKLILFAIAIGAVADLILDPLYLLTGLYIYPGAVESLTLFYGEYFQFPLYEIPTIGLWLGVTCSIRYFRDDKGRSIAERGLDRLKVKGRRRTWVRFFALTGLVNVVFFLSYSGPLGIFALNATGYPEAHQERSYFMSGTCGPETDRACPGTEVPLSRPESAYLDPDGNLEAPDGEISIPRFEQER